jgi:hypothetical protein
MHGGLRPCVGLVWKRALLLGLQFGGLVSLSTY